MAKNKARKAAPEATGENGSTATPDVSPRVHQREKVGFDFQIRERPDWTDNQRRLIDLILAKDTKLVLVDGPAGTSKTFVAVYCALQLIRKRAVSDLLYVRSLAESASKSIGALPGEESAKLNPFLAPLFDKMDELLTRGDADRLVKDERVVGRPINFLRGTSFNARFILGDEMQNMSHGEAVTLITRLGAFSKMVLVGDRRQSDIAKSGWPRLYDLFDDEPSKAQGIHCFRFTHEDIVRSGVVRYIVEKLEGQALAAAKNEPMFPAR